MSAPAVPIPFDQPVVVRGLDPPEHLPSAHDSMASARDVPIVEAELIESLRESERLRDLLREEMRDEVRVEILADFDAVQRRLPLAYATAAPNPQRVFGSNNGDSNRVEAFPEHRRLCSRFFSNNDASKKRSLLILAVMTVTLVVIVAVTVSTILSKNDSPQWKVQNEMFGVSETEQFGYAVAVSGDGSTVAASSLTSFNNIGSVKVFRKTEDGAWSQHGAVVLGIEVDGKFGVSVDLSYEGNVLVAGASNGDSNTGYVTVYSAPRTSSTDWIQVGSTLYGEATGDRFGSSVSISGDTRTIAVGAPTNEDNGRGYVRVFSLGLDEEWIDISTNDFRGRNIGGAFGRDVSLSFDGRVLAVSSDDNKDTGRVVIYDRTNNDWEKRFSFFGEDNHSMLGRSVDLSENGKILAFGVPGGSAKDRSATMSYEGIVKVYRIDKEEPEQIGSDLYGTSAHDLFGWSIDLSHEGLDLDLSDNLHEGMKLVVGAIHSPRENSRSYVRMFQYNGQNWRSK